QGWFLDDVRIATDGVVVQPPPGSRRPGLVRLPPPGGFLYLLMTGPVARIERSPDVNASGEINAFDLATLVQHFGSAAGGANYNAACDLDDDGRVSLVDLTYMLLIASDPSCYTPLDLPEAPLGQNQP